MESVLRLFGTIFKQIRTCTKKSSVRLFWVYWKTWNVAASPLRSIINDKVEAMRVAGISALHYLAAEP